jgi:TolA-binding protein
MEISGEFPRLRFGLVCSIACAIISAASIARSEPLGEMSLERWKKLREAERYQLNIAEKYYRQPDYKVAITEYEKYLRLYEKSEAAPYAHLKWSLCLVQRRQQNTAIRDGFQSILEYWPESPEAVAAAYYIGSTYKSMGELAKAKKAYAHVLAKYPSHNVAVFARVDLADIARIEGDEKRRAARRVRRRVPEPGGVLLLHRRL